MRFSFLKTIPKKFMYSGVIFMMSGVTFALSGNAAPWVYACFFFSGIAFITLGITYRTLSYVTIAGPEITVREKLFSVRHGLLSDYDVFRDKKRIELRSKSGQKIIFISAFLLSEPDFEGVYAAILGQQSTRQ